MRGWPRTARAGRRDSPGDERAPEMTARPTSRTLGDLVDEMAAQRPHAQALAFRHEPLSYAALQARVDSPALSWRWR